ncbi:MAG: DUF72 domain-containing protein [Cyclobacteriaceae bacterium]|nr:DUF72 domain-containing protein [Cyclobacteriaceae bacterium]
MSYKIGCSGYYYPSWKNKFYPKGIQPKEWLTYYSSVFNTVELNGAFYKTPSLASLRKYSTGTPDDFCFSVKMSKSITHYSKLKETRQLILDFQDLIEEGLQKKLMHFLFQLPPSFHYSEENLERIINNIPNEQRNVVEFRHPSWWNEKVTEAFENANLTFCNIDFPGMKTSFVHTSPSFYLRLHGNPELFKSSYNINELQKIYRSFPTHCKSHAVYFNNTYYEAGYTNASQLMEISNSKSTQPIIQSIH